MKKVEFPNGFESWYETHHEVVKLFSIWEDQHNWKPLEKMLLHEGIGGAYKHAKDITDNFEKKYKDEIWEKLDFFETIEDFTANYIKNLTSL